MRSEVGHVTLSKVQLSASGTYRCEVITEAPTFVTMFGEGNMTVIGETICDIIFNIYSYTYK